MESIGITFGAFTAKPLREQLQGHGIHVNENKLALLEKMYFALNAMRLHGVLTSSEFDRAAKRFVKLLSEWSEVLVITPEEEYLGRHNGMKT